MTQYRVNGVPVLHAAFLLVTATVLALALVAMHSVTSPVFAAPEGIPVSSSANPHSDMTADISDHGSRHATVELCPCPSGPDSSQAMRECTLVATNGGVVVAAPLRAGCPEAALLPPITMAHTGTLTGPLAPSLHVLSISRT